MSGTVLDSFLRDYGTLTASAAAIINGFIAVVVAQLFKDHRPPKIILLVVAALVGASAIAAIFYSQHNIVVERAAEGQRRAADVQRDRDIRNELGKFIAGGLALMRGCEDQSTPS